MKKNKLITTNENGQRVWDQMEGDRYLATGIDRRGIRFCITSTHWNYIGGLNVWKGSKWLIRDGKRYLITRITN